MEYASIGRTDFLIGRVGFGCAAMGGYDYGAISDNDSIASVHRALELGINFFDTADVYGFGHAEEILGKALRGRNRDVIVATKVGLSWDSHGHVTRDLSRRRILAAVDDSLRRLHLDCIPLYQIHWPDENTPLEESMAALKQCQEAGKIAAIGCCNFSKELIDSVQNICRVESVQLPYSVVDRRYDDVIEHAYQKHEMSILCYNVLSQGLLTGKYDRGSRFTGTDLRRRSDLFQQERIGNHLDALEELKRIAHRHGRTPSQVAVRCVLERPGVTCAITGIKTPEQLEENAGSVGWSFGSTDVCLTNRKEAAAHGSIAH